MHSGPIHILAGVVRIVVISLILVWSSPSWSIDTLPGFPVAIPPAVNGQYGRLVVGDLAGGPEKEILCIRGSTLIMVDSAGQPVPGYPLVLGLELYSHIYLADVTLSNLGPEIVVIGKSPKKIRVLDPSGAALFPDMPMPPSLWETTSFLADLDGDGDDEILLLSSIASGGVGSFYAYHGEGTTVAGYPLPIPALEFGMSPGYATAADLDYDGRAELAVTDAVTPTGIDDDVLFVVMRSDGSLLPGFPYEPTGGNTVGLPVLADLDAGSNVKSEIVGNGLQSLSGLRYDGSIHWPMEFVPGCTYAEPIVGNFDLDPRLEVVISDSDLLQIFDPDSANVVGTWNEGYQILNIQEPTAGDIDGDGVDEIVMIAYLQGPLPDARLHVIDPLTMTNEPGWPHSFGQVNGETPFHATLEDIDLDGDLEIITILGDMIHVLDPPNPGAPVHRASWPTWRGNYARNRDYHYDKPPYPHLVRGDANRDSQVNLADVLRIGQILFVGHPTQCPLAVDVNGDGSRDIADMITVVSYLFLAGVEPAPPFPDCEPIPRTPECMVFSCP